MKSKIYIVALVLLIGTALVSGFMIYRHYAEEKKYTDEFQSLAEIVSQSTEESGEYRQDAEIDNSGYSDYSAVYQLNPDMVGWIYIEGTTINYPVMQTPDNPDYYLKHNFYGEYSSHGVPYADASCNVFEPSDNVIIYGHHIKGGKMFGALESYKDRGFYEQHKIICFDTIEQEAKYEIIAVFKTVAYSSSGFAFHEYINAADEDEFDGFVSKCKSLSLYDTGVAASYGDKLLTLSTCEYSNTNGRLVVVAKQIVD